MRLQPILAVLNKWNFLQQIDAFHSLFLYGAGGLVALGYYVNQEMGVSSSFYPVLWFAGGLYVYNLDRLIPDPADLINQPERSKFKGVRKPLIIICLAILILFPIFKREWLILGLIFTGILISSFYCLSVPGSSRRIKDITWLKWLTPPLVIMVTLTIPTWIIPEQWASIVNHWPVLSGLFVALLTNILLFDLRDRLGDSLCGVITLPVKLQRNQFFWLLGIMVIIQALLVFLFLKVEMIILVLYVALLVGLAPKKRTLGFYHWAVDGMLFVPLLCKWIIN